MSQIISQNNERIAKNTLFLYFRMMLTMIVALFTSRVIFNALGVVDYGLNHIVSGVITLFSFLNGALGASTSRFMTFALGRKETGKLKDVFRTAFNIHAALAVVVIILCETAGLWIVNHLLVIPPERLFACNVVYQFVVVCASLNITQVPLSATIIAHERMAVYAYLGISDAALKLTVAYLVTISSYDKLITLGAINLCISAGMYIFHHRYNKKHFREYNFGSKTDNKLFREMLGYSVWNLIGSTAFMLKNQGINILINIFFGPMVNAANAIAYQVNNVATNFANSFTVSLNPQITKTYACDEMQQMKNLIFRGGRFSFFLLMILSIPILLETEILLDFWLKNVPRYAAGLTRLILLLTLTESFAITIGMGIQAAGKIKHYQLLTGCVYLLNFPVAYLFYRSGAAPYAALVIAIALALVNVFVHLYFLKKYICIGISDYFRNVLLVSAMVMFASSVCPTITCRLMDEGVVRLLAVTLVSVFSSMGCIYLFGLQKPEREKARIFISDQIRRVQP